MVRKRHGSGVGAIGACHAWGGQVHRRHVLAWAEHVMTCHTRRIAFQRLAYNAVARSARLILLQVRAYRRYPAWKHQGIIPTISR